MPTISEHFAALFDRNMRAVLRNPRAICLIENPSERVQMAAVRQDKGTICLIDKPVESVQLAAVHGSPNTIHLIDSPTERVQLYVTGKNPGYVSFLAHPTEKVQLAAVERNPECISLIRQPTEKVQLAAVLKDARYIAKIGEPSEKAQLAAVQKDPENIRFIANPAERVQCVAVRENPAVLRHIAFPSDEARRIAASGIGMGETAGTGTASGSVSTSKNRAARKQPLPKAARSAAGKLAGEMEAVRGRYNDRLLQASYTDDPIAEKREIAEATCRMDEELSKVFEEFNSAAVPDRQDCNVKEIIRNLRKEGVKVEDMQTESWYSLMKGKALDSSTLPGMASSAGKGKSLLLTRTPTGYVLKAVNMVNNMSRQASADM